MRKIVTLLLAVLICYSPMTKAEVPAKAKAFMTIVGYGTASGALLGAASMAFGNSTRAVAQGASLGLYAGIIFGSYVLISHANRRSGSYSSDSSPYQSSHDIYGDDYDRESGGADSGDQKDRGFFDRMQAIQTKFQPKTKGGNLPPVYLNIFQYNF